MTDVVLFGFHAKATLAVLIMINTSDGRGDLAMPTVFPG